MKYILNVRNILVYINSASNNTSSASVMLRWLDTVFKNSGVQHFDMFKLRIFRIYSADIGFFIYFDNSTFKLY